VTFLHRLVAMDGLVSVTDRLGDTNLRFVRWSDVFRSNAISWRFSWDYSAKRGLLDRFGQPGVDWYLVPVRNCVTTPRSQASWCWLRVFEGFMAISSSFCHGGLLRVYNVRVGFPRDFHSSLRLLVAL
jgi:hypothetical protein